MTEYFKDYITQLAKINSPGRFLSFSTFHLFRILEILSLETVGRNKLAQRLSVGGGAIRTILGRLSSAGLVITSKAGYRLTSRGQAVWGEIAKAFPIRASFSTTELTSSKYGYAFLVREGAQRIGSGIEQRDAAIIAGASSSTIIIYHDGHLQIRSVSDNAEKEFPNAASQILQTFKPNENDIVVIAGGDTALKAMRGAFAASWSLLDTEHGSLATKKV